ncbi:hypothetical protein [Thermoflexus sp.]|uniref:hypothetical protein n=1 Tax=Thermoflexus sp. TaxID=1969742 RepID=UPI0025F52E2C|nr:hypothetical protein [Thermoflexus sp.]MDW8065586.1 hypothetical protein [Anaerolineae bacterium]MCS6963387.1 hypothetical protein [Thermoflexus sp.]MCS7351859.1 hypothetical protein [Thermoflexus sp.]MCX7689248.1 hypothetical protein [Thermoflexus sp.]MDW8181318.1 hypothetical protein [Anaerolineae bacterium]
MSSTRSASSTSRWWMIAIGLALIGLCGCGLCVGSGGLAVVTAILGAVGWVQAEARPAQAVAEQFLTALREARWEAAYALCAPSFRDELRGPETLAQTYGGARQPAGWSFRSWNVQREDGVRRAQLGGTLTTAGGEALSFEIELVVVRAESEETWRVSAFRLLEE